MLEELDLDRHGKVDAAVVAYPHGAAAPGWRSSSATESWSSTCAPTFACATSRCTSDHYGEHAAPELLAGAVYGLPELHRDEVRGADVVANPGCFPTATLLALAPLARAGLLGDVIVDAKTGVSGAGRQATEITHFVSADENVNAYGCPCTGTSPEMDQELAALGAPVAATFVPHLVPLDQGELCSCYVTPLRETSADEARSLFDDAYAREPFVELAERPPGVRDVRDTNLCRIPVHRDPRTGRLLVFAAIDNLWKGTASQAVQNLNLMFGLPEEEGIA